MCTWRWVWEMLVNEGQQLWNDLSLYSFIPDVDIWMYNNNYYNNINVWVISVYIFFIYKINEEWKLYILVKITMYYERISDERDKCNGYL